MLTKVSLWKTLSLSLLVSASDAEQGEGSELGGNNQKEVKLQYFSYKNPMKLPFKKLK